MVFGIVYCWNLSENNSRYFTEPLHGKDDKISSTSPGNPSKRQGNRTVTSSTRAIAKQGRRARAHDFGAAEQD